VGRKQPTVFNKKIFYGGRSRTTGIPDLENMFQTFEGYPATFKRASDYFKYPDGRILFTAYKLTQALRENRIIVGCKIEPSFGRLKCNGTIAHWVVLETACPEGRGGAVSLLNPASNSIETYSWDEVVSSVGKIPYGIVIPR